MLQRAALSAAVAEQPANVTPIVTVLHLVPAKLARSSATAQPVMDADVILKA